MAVDNSYDESYVEYIRAFGWDVGHIDPRGKSNQVYIWESQDLLRRKFLESDCEYYFSLESDIFPPFDIVERLIAHELPIVGVPYFIDLGKASYLLIQQLDVGISPKLDLTGYNMHPIASFMLMDGRLKLTNGNGIGCTLIHRDVIESVPFRIVDGMIYHSDSYFYEDLFLMGIENYIDTSIHIQHRNSDWGKITDMDYKENK
uniref:Glycosyltransferase n=1 Tax=viral metagenome TaxID=1070528 RepID=A0A6M3J5I1_9ZZZZ